jgi:hypothetical protein
MSAFDNITAASAQEHLGADSDPHAATSRAFYDGDHWQKTAGWAGPAPATTDSGYTETLALIEAAFVSKNTIREVVQRHQAAVIGREPMWRLVPNRPLEDGEDPSDEEDALASEAEAILATWWDRRKAHRTLQAFCTALLTGSRAALRLFVPRGRLQDGAVPRVSAADAWRLVFLSVPEPGQAGVYTDPASMEELGVYAYTEEDETGKTGGTRVEVSYLDDEGRTVLRVLGAETEQQSQPLQLGGRLSIFEGTRDAFLTPQVHSLQRLLNMALSMMQRNSVLGGFLERAWVEDAAAPGGRRFVPDARFQVGAGSTNFIAGLETMDSAGKVTVASPSVVYRDPVPVATFVETAQTAYRGILEETHQTHALISGDAVASGESRIQARADFEADLGRTKPVLDDALRWVLETVLAFVAEFSGQAGRYEPLRVDAYCILDPGPIPTEENRTTVELVNAELLSRETGMSRVGVDDPAAERAKIEAEREAEVRPRVFPEAEGDEDDEPEVPAVPSGEDEEQEAA